ncbi:hypothetical protein Fmac_029463 [Flemingia macrophylla]|uniref:Uncharacterized protein n=1 Tax=Flemingia macrophylla TaxID=520843 RepID=A0ABD1LAF2_9FABA
MASLVLLFSELVRNHEFDAAALLAAYPPSKKLTFTTSCAAVFKDEMQKKKTKETVVENPMESRVSLDFLVWP